MLGTAEGGLARLAKDLGDGAAFAALDPVIQVFEDPIQALAQGPAHTGLACSHEADQEDNLGHGWVTPRRRVAPHTRARVCGYRFRGTLIQTIPVSFVYFAERFLRWILPLKLRRTTVDDTAARPMVPQKALPSLRANEVCCLGCRGISSWTSPRTERALTSAEVVSGTMASMSPLWLVRRYSPWSPKSPT